MDLTFEENFRNRLFEFKVQEAEREFQHREEQARIKNEWFRKAYPDSPEWIKASYGINMVGRRRVIG